MADLNTAQKVELIVTDGDGDVVTNQLTGSSVDGEAVIVTVSDQSIFLVAQEAGIATVHVSRGPDTGSIVVTVEEAGAGGTLTLTLGTPVPQ